MLQPLSTIAHGRSGDKGNHANVAIIAYTAAGFDWLRDHLTAEVVAAYFAPLGASRVERYEAANVWGLNFLLRDVTKPDMARRYVDDYLAKLAAFKAKGGHLVWTIHNTVSHDSPFADLELEMSRRIVEMAVVLHLHAAGSVADEDPARLRA